MLTAAWLVKGSAWGWGLLQSASPARCLGATVAAAAAAAAARSRRGGERWSGPPARLAASSSSLAECHSPSSPGTGRRLLLRVRPPSPKHLGTASWAPPFGCSSGGPGQPHCSRAGCGSATRRAAESSERPDAGKTERRGYAELYENPWTIPNLLSMARIGLAPILGYLIIEEDFNVALGVFALAGITDLLDGFIARNWANQKSALGSALDPLADKILISILYISLTCANLIPENEEDLLTPMQMGEKKNFEQNYIQILSNDVSLCIPSRVDNQECPIKKFLTRSLDHASKCCCFCKLCFSHQYSIQPPHSKAEDTFPI